MMSELGIRFHGDHARILFNFGFLGGEFLEVFFKLFLSFQKFPKVISPSSICIVVVSWNI